MNIEEYDLHRVHLELPQPIGDSQVIFRDHWLTALELRTDTGLNGIGFELQQGKPIAGLKQLKEMFEFNAWPTLKGAHPLSLAMSISDARGGNVGAAAMPLATETAIWDLVGQFENLPLYKLFGGDNPHVRAYGSTLDYHLDDEQFRQKLEECVQQGFGGVKIKVGHPDIKWELKRMAIVHEIMGSKVDLMVDANEAWSVKETMIRLCSYRDAGFDIYWIEDPIRRDDFKGYNTLCSELPFTRINTGEYLGYSGKRKLLENHAVDVLNIHGQLNDSRNIARLASDYGLPVALGNTLLEIGVHLAASLPNCLYMEFSNLMWNVLACDPVIIKNGIAIAPDRPGHGIKLDRTALENYSVPE